MTGTGRQSTVVRSGAREAATDFRMSNAPAAPAEPFDVAVSMTGSTIAKTYDQRKAVLQNIHPVIKAPFDLCD